MGLTKPNQELRHDLKEIAGLLKWSGVDLMTIAIHLSEVGLEAEARSLLAVLESFPGAEDKLAALAEEVKAGIITRAKAE